ncbi:MAG: acylphosphatase [Victivallales bacterium]|jgi:acylphosphatase
MKTWHYKIFGRVQGVAFRHYTIREAEKWGISGTVKNLHSGEVEVFAQGDDPAITQFESFLHTGPRSARVEKVEKEIIDLETAFIGFDITW